MRLQKTKRGISLLHGEHVVSELLSLPGPTHNVFDVLAAAVMVVSPGPDAAMLGFAGGGTVAALRGLGWDFPVTGVDLEHLPTALFRNLTRRWSGRVTLVRSDAVQFLAGSVRRYGAIVEDLSVQLPDGDVQKPPVSFTELPALMAQRITPTGVAVLNLLPEPKRGWVRILQRARAPFAQAVLLNIAGYENRVLVGARRLPRAPVLGARIESCLEVLGSELMGTVTAQRL